MFRLSHCLRSAIAAASLSCPFVASAWDGQSQGTIGLIEIAEAGNYGVRVWLVNQTPMCGTNSPAWVYFEESDANYKSNIAAILMAKAQDLQVVVYGTLDSGGHCRLAHLTVL